MLPLDTGRRSDPYSADRDRPAVRSLTPVYAIALHAVLGGVYPSGRTFDQLAATFVLGFMPFSALAAVAVWRLRRTRPDLHRPLPPRRSGGSRDSGVLVAIVLTGDALVETPEIAGLKLLISLAGVPAFGLWPRRVQSHPRPH